MSGASTKGTGDLVRWTIAGLVVLVVEVVWFGVVAAMFGVLQVDDGIRISPVGQWGWFAVVAPLVLGVQIASLAAWYRRWRATQDGWAGFAAERGGEMRSGLSPQVHTRAEEWTLTLDVYNSGGKNSQTYTRVRAPYVPKREFRFLLMPQTAVHNFMAGAIAGLGGLFAGPEALKQKIGGYDIRLGDPEFDDRFILWSNDEAAARALFSGLGMGLLRSLEGRISFENMREAKTPAGVEVLTLQVTGMVTDAQVLRDMHDLMAETLRELRRLDLIAAETPSRGL